MFGFFKKRQPATPPPITPENKAHFPEAFWDDDGIGRLVPIYLQLYLASRSPQHKLTRRPDGSIETNDVPALMIFYDEDPRRQQRIRTDFVKMMHERLPIDPSVLSGLTNEEIVSRLSSIYTQITGKDMYGIVCKKWCVEKKLIV